MGMHWGRDTCNSNALTFRLVVAGAVDRRPPSFEASAKCDAAGNVFWPSARTAVASSCMIAAQHTFHPPVIPKSRVYV